MLFRKVFNALVSTARHYKVVVLGAATEVGQPLSLLLRTAPRVTSLALQDDLDHTPGVVMDLSNIPADSKIQAYVGPRSLAKALADADLVLVVGGLIQKPGITEKTWFKTNYEYVHSTALELAKLSPMPFVGIVTEPINSLVPMAAEVMRNYGSYEPLRMFGVTGRDAMAAQTLYAAAHGLSPRQCAVPVVGGHSDKTLVPLLSHAAPARAVPDDAAQEYTTALRRSDLALTAAKMGWSPTVSVAHSALVFASNVLEALDGHQVQINAFVENDDYGCQYFGGPMLVDSRGVNTMQKYTNVSPYEQLLLQSSVDQLRKDVLKGKKILEYD